MKYVLISAFDALLERSMPLQCIQPMEDEDIVFSHKKAVLEKQIPAEKAENLVIFKYGTFNDVNGELELLPTPVKICALSQFLPRKVSEVNENVRDTSKEA